MIKCRECKKEIDLVNTFQLRIYKEDSGGDGDPFYLLGEFCDNCCKIFINKLKSKMEMK
jgi:hypothetical protein